MLRTIEKCLLAGVFGLFVAPFAVAAPLSSPVYTFDDKDKDDEAEEEEEEEEPEEILAIIGGDIYTGTGAFLRGATLLARDGKIEQIGYDVDIPEEAKRIDATGMRLYPGLVVTSSSGLLGGSGDLRDSINPFSQNMILGLAAGITTTGAGSTAVKLKRFEIEGAVIEDGRALQSVPWSNRNPSGKTKTREKLKRAAQYLRELQQWEVAVKKDKELEEPSKRGIDSTSLAILRGEKTPKFNSSSRSELLGIARLAQEFGFSPVIEGAAEGWTIADELGRANATVIINPRYRRWKDESLVRDGGSSIENAAILHKAGCQIVVLPSSRGISLGGIVGRDIMHLTIEAGFAVRGGLSEKAAIEAITIAPARVMGISHRVGSLEVGKDADVIVTDGDLLHYQTFVQYAVVDGKIAYDKQEELYFAHIRPRPESELAPESKVDPGEEVDEESEDEKSGEDEDSEDKKSGDDEGSEDEKSGDDDEPEDEKSGDDDEPEDKKSGDDDE